MLKIAGRIDNMNTANLHLALNLLEITLGKAEFQRIIVSVIETLSHLCGSSTFQPKELPDTASYPHLKLMNALLLIPTIRKLFLRLPNVNRLIEGFLTRKQPTPMDLKVDIKGFTGLILFCVTTFRSQIAVAEYPTRQNCDVQ